MNLYKLPGTRRYSIVRHLDQITVFLPKRSSKSSQIYSIIGKSTQRPHLDMQHLNSHLWCKNNLFFPNIKSKTQFISFLSNFLFNPPIDSIFLQLSNNFLQSPDDFQPRSRILSKKMNSLILTTNNQPIFIILSTFLHVFKQFKP